MIDSLYISIIKTPMGFIEITANSSHLLKICLTPIINSNINEKSLIINKFVNELNQYFMNPFYIFNTPIKLEGTVFQIEVWKKLQSIPPGNTVTYGEIAKQLHTAAQAVGQACKSNKFPLIIPCHRVVSKTHLGGFCGKTSKKNLDLKNMLLSHEKAFI